MSLIDWWKYLRKSIWHPRRICRGKWHHQLTKEILCCGYRRLLGNFLLVVFLYQCHSLVLLHNLYFVFWLTVLYLTVLLHFFCTASIAKQDAEDGPNISCPASRNESWAINWGPGAVFRTSLPVLVSLTDLTAYPFMNPKYHWRHINTNEKNRSVITKRYQKGHIQESA